MSNAEKIQDWRDANPGEPLTEARLLTILGIDSLHHADLSRADLRDANLRDANLWGVNLRDANLWGVNLADADLADANLRRADLADANLADANLAGMNLAGANLAGANLAGANLADANLRRANLHNNSVGILTVDGAHPYRAMLVPTPYGWVLTIGCWNGTVSELRALIAQDEGWPEATGKNIQVRRPILEAIADLCDAHIARHAGLIDDLAMRWDS